MPCVETIFTKYRNIVGTNPAPNEALSRCFVNLVIFHSVLEERIAIHDAQAQELSLPTPNPYLLRRLSRLLQSSLIHFSNQHR